MTRPVLVTTEDQEALREVARAFLADRLGTDVVRAVMATAAGTDEQHWAQVAAMGWPGLVVPEDLGGAGYGWAELAVVVEEAGRAVAPLPLLSVAMGTAVLLDHATPEQRAILLPGIAAGEVRPAVALPVAGADPVASVDGRLAGTVRHVVDGATADLVVVATTDGAMLVPTDRDGVTATPVDVLDQTRPQADLVLDDVAVADADRLDGDPDAVMARARTVGAVLLASEQVGVASAVLDLTVDYARTRRQFGRAIGSFQAIKHLLADDLVALESARSVAMHAARVLADDDREELAIAVPMAAARCGDVAVDVAADAIQVHGGIGFTWEHDAHLYFKRASSSRLLLGTPSWWRRQLGDALGL